MSRAKSKRVNNSQLFPLLRSEEVSSIGRQVGQCYLSSNPVASNEIGGLVIA